MAVYRQLHTSFWQDPFVMGLTPEEKYFYIYLLTNSKTKQCGIYELPIRVAEFETGYNRETVEKLLTKFSSTYQRIQYDWQTSELAVRNWLKYNPYTNPKIKVCVDKELTQIKNKDLIAYIHGDGVSRYPIGGVSQKEKEKEKEEEEEKEEEVKSKPKTKFSPPTIHEVIAHFEDKGQGEESDLFYNHYQSVGWKVGRNSMKDWKAAANKWIMNSKKYAANQKRTSKTDYSGYIAGSRIQELGDATIGEVFGVTR